MGYPASRHFCGWYWIASLGEWLLSFLSRCPTKFNLRVLLGSSLESQEYSRSDPSCWPRGTLYPQNLALFSSLDCQLWLQVICLKDSLDTSDNGTQHYRFSRLSPLSTLLKEQVSACIFGWKVREAPELGLLERHNLSLFQNAKWWTKTRNSAILRIIRRYKLLISNISVCPEHLWGYIMPWVDQLMEEKSVFNGISCMMFLVPHMLTIQSGNFITTNHMSLCDPATSGDN
jgi:hypothetical protein